MKSAKIPLKVLYGLILFGIGAFIWNGINNIDPSKEGGFDGERAYENVVYQVSLGPRTPNSQGHENIVSWMVEMLIDNAWQVERQNLDVKGVSLTNIIAKREGGGPKILLGAHYDTRLFADQDSDPNLQLLPVPGANDGASGVAVLMELARVLPAGLEKEVWLVFFDGEDNGGIDGRDWALGSRGFVQELRVVFDAVVIVDMVGDSDLNIFKERASDESLSAEIWAQASDFGYDQFDPNIKYHMLDDHTAFIQAGMPTVLIIDFDYPYWHTSLDDPGKVSAESLSIVGKTLFGWLLSE